MEVAAILVAGSFGGEECAVIDAEPSVYSPEFIDKTLRQWGKYEAAAERCRSSAPGVGRGGRYDALAGADRVADIERAIALCFKQWSLEWNIVDHVKRGHSVSKVALALHVRKADALKAYDQACVAMAGFLGWDG